MNKPSVRMIAAVSILAAMVYVTSAFLQIPIPTPIGSTRLHLGNVMCLLSGMLLGPWYGGLAAGFGSMLFDLLNPAYIASPLPGLIHLRWLRTEGAYTQQLCEEVASGTRPARHRLPSSPQQLLPAWPVGLSANTLE